MTQPHIPVLLDEVIAAIKPGKGMGIVDATFGAGGYTRALLDAGARVYAFDRDPNAIREGQAMVSEYEGRLSLHQERFASMREELLRVQEVRELASGLRELLEDEEALRSDSTGHPRDGRRMTRPIG